jgi:RNA polymerase sigma-70 factor, ECF subfamily
MCHFLLAANIRSHLIVSIVKGMSIAPHIVVTRPPGDLERIFREHYDFVHRTAHRVTGNSQDAEDVLQTLFLRLFRREGSPDLGTNPKAYLYRATVNIALDVVRLRKRQNLTDAETPLQEIPFPPAASRGAEELNSYLLAAIAELHPKAAEILLLKYVHGYADREIASLLGTTRGTVAVSLFRSRARLRKSIRQYSGGKS